MMDYTEFPLLEGDTSESAMIPNYVKIYDIIFNLISQGLLTNGDVIPSENTLAGYWNVSRGTVRMAMRKLEEDGYINKTQGKQAVVATYADQTQKGLHWLYNLSVDNCLDTIDEIQVKISYQSCGIYIAHELGYEKPGFLVVSVSSDYYAKNCHVANTVTIFNAQLLEEFHLDINKEEEIKQFVVKDIYQHARRSKIIFNVLNADEDTVIRDLEPEEPVIIMEEILLGEIEKRLAYCKLRLRGNKYRFLMERKAPM
jgi:DNA-binding GntR family transcriptional regulator